MWIAIISALAGFAGMEPLSWAIHKYLMHGPLWVLHKTHHAPDQNSILELNDLFSLFFASCSIGLITWGVRFSKMVPLGFGFGIATYGLVYFILHDIFIHKRLKVVKKVKWNSFFQRLAKAHYIHHQNRKSPESRFFGLLLVKEK